MVVSNSFVGFEGRTIHRYDDDDDDDDSFGWWEERKRYRRIREDTFPNNLFFLGRHERSVRTMRGILCFLGRVMR